MKRQKKSKDRVVSRREGKMHWEHIEICDQCIFPSQRRQHAGFVLFMMLHGEISGLDSYFYVKKRSAKTKRMTGSIC